MYLALSVFTGFLVALMIQLNGILQTSAGGLTALMSIHICGLAGAGLFFILFRRKMTGNPGEHSPRWCLAAGAVGTVIVYLASVTFEKGGILMSLSGSLAGQTLAASVAESFYGKDRERSPMIQRILSPALLIPGSIIIGLKAGAGMGWIALSWLPGIILMVQQSMNARNTLAYGTPATVILNYISALIVIIPLFLLSSAKADAVSLVTALPRYIVAGGGLIGVFTTGMIAYLLLKAPALLVVLGIFTGELAGGIGLDLYNGNPVAVEKMIGVAVITAGLAIGKAGGKKAPGKSLSSPSV